MQLRHGRASGVGFVGRDNQVQLGVEIDGCRLLQRPVRIVGFAVGLVQLYAAVVSTSSLAISYLSFRSTSGP